MIWIDWTCIWDKRRSLLSRSIKHSITKPFHYQQIPLHFSPKLQTSLSFLKYVHIILLPQLFPKVSVKLCKQITNYSQKYPLSNDNYASTNSTVYQSNQNSIRAFSMHLILYDSYILLVHDLLLAIQNPTSHIPYSNSKTLKLQKRFMQAELHYCSELAAKNWKIMK